MTAKKKYIVGAEIEAYCAKCKMDRLHAIETLKSDGNINRVVCRTCDSHNLFRRPKGPGGAKATPSKRRKKGSVLVTEEELTKAKRYSLTGSFEAGDFIKHTKFGPGKVLEIRPGGKMEVKFEAGPKLLVCAPAELPAPKTAKKREKAS